METTGLEFGDEFFPVISWSLEDEMTVFQESHKLLLAVMKTLHLFKYFCICHENISLYLTFGHSHELKTVGAKQLVMLYPAELHTL